MTDELELLAASAEAEPQYSPTERATARARLDALITAEAGRTSAAFVSSAPQDQKARLRRQLQWLALMAAGLLVAGGLVLGRGSLDPGSRQIRAHLTAASVLRRAALVARDVPVRAVPGPGQFLYTKQEISIVSIIPLVSTPSTNPPMAAMIDFFDQYKWVSSNGAGREVEVETRRPTFLSPADEARWRANGSAQSVFQGTSGSYSTGPNEIKSASRVDALPTNPSTLTRMFAEGRIDDVGEVFPTGHPYDTAATWNVISNLLLNTLDPPALLSALYRVAASLPGVQYVGTVTDPAGQSGTAVGYEQDGVLNEIIFDPKTAALLASESVVESPASSAAGFVAGDDPKVGTVVSSTTVLSSRIVNSERASSPELEWNVGPVDCHAAVQRSGAVRCREPTSSSQTLDEAVGHLGCVVVCDLSRVAPLLESDGITRSPDHRGGCDRRPTASRPHLTSLVGEGDVKDHEHPFALRGHPMMKLRSTTALDNELC